MTRAATAFTLAVGLVAAIFFVAHRRAAYKQAAEPPAPAFNVTDLSGQTISLANLRGKVVLVNFWAAWCTPCRAEIPQFVRLQEKYRAQGFQLVGISIDDPEGALRDFCRESRVNYPIVMGDQTMAEKFGAVLGLPTSFLIGRDGRIHARQVGATDFPKIEREISALLRARG
jgi:peroxiredoxin